MPIEMGKLIFLQTSSFFIMGKESGCGIKELKSLQHLKGELWIRGLEHVKNETEARNSNLFQNCLQSLSLCWSSGLPDTEEAQAQLLVGEGLQPHPNLKRLSIDGYGGVIFPHWIVAGVSLCLSDMVKVTLRNCCKCENSRNNLVNYGSLGSLNCVIWIQ